MQLDTSSLVAIAGIVFTFAGNIIVAIIENRQKKHGPKPDEEEQPLLKIVTILFRLAFVASVGLAIYFLFLQPKPKTTIQIVYPTDGASVALTDKVKGTSFSSPSDGTKRIWVMVYAPNFRYYPQNNSVQVQANGDWADQVTFGAPGDVDKGKSFDIIAVLADDDAQKSIQAYLVQYKDQPTAPGLEAIPAGAQLYSRITVKRQ